jgi:hypothetical protein
VTGSRRVLRQRRLQVARPRAPPLRSWRRAGSLTQQQEFVPIGVALGAVASVVWTVSVIKPYEGLPEKLSIPVARHGRWTRA